MKICSYCGTGMDNDVMKCPFCRMEMDIRGAVKYQDDEPFDPNAFQSRARDSKTPAELRYEAGLEESEEKTGFSYKDFLKDDPDDLSVDAKTLLERERKKEEIQTAWSEFTKWAETRERKETPKIEFNLPGKTKKKAPTISGFITFFVFALVFIIVTVTGFISEDYREEEVYYPTTENFVPGSYENGIYQNEYTGITYVVSGEFDSSELDPFSMPEIEDTEEDYTFYTEFYVSRESDYMYISYENAEYCACETIEEYIDLLYVSGPDTELISEETVSIRGDDFYKAITHNEYETNDGDTESYYYCVLVRKVTDDYFAMIEINTEKLESIDDFLLGFEYGEDFEEV